MGLPLLTAVTDALDRAGVYADLAHPGKVFCQPEKICAGVYLKKAEGGTLTVGVDLVGPANLGGPAVEQEAVKAAKALENAGARCKVDGCKWDGFTRAFICCVTAEFEGVKDPGGSTFGNAFSVFLGQTALPWAHSCLAEKVTETVNQVSVTYWRVRIEEQFPNGTAESARPGDGFTLKISTDSQNETFPDCRLIGESRSFTRDGLKCVRTWRSASRTVAART